MRAYGFSRWQVQKRAPQLCRRCPLRDACPIEDWPEVHLQRVPDRADLSRGPIPAGPATAEGEGGEVVWLTAESLGDAARVALVEPAPEGTAAYRMPDAEPVIVRCGMPAPPTFTIGVALQAVNGVQWFNEPDPDPAVTASTWVAVDRPQYVAVTLPEGSGTGPIQDLSDAITAVLEEVEPDPAPVG